MATVTQVLDKARSQIGVIEKPTNRTPYGAWFGMDGQPWCAMFVSWVFNEVGLPLPAKTPKGFAYCPDGVNYFKRIRRWFDTPEVGDVVFYKFDGDGLSDHVGIVESINHDGSIVVIEGNTNAAGSANGDRVMRRTRQRNQIMGFGRPNYFKGVRRMYDPPLSLEPIVASLACPTGGVWLLAESGAVYAFGGAPYKGGVNGRDYFAGRKAVKLQLHSDGLYEIVATSGELYAPREK